MPDDDLALAPTPDRLSQFANAVMAGDPVGAAAALRAQTEIPVQDGWMTLVGIAAVIYAVASVLKQVRPVAQPIADAVGDRIREAPEARQEASETTRKP